MLLQTKFLAPTYNSKSVERGHLLGRLQPRNGRKLVLVSAPAGYGKTTLVSQWLSYHDKEYCWLSLDSYDDEPRRFWQYLIGSVCSKVPGFGVEAQHFLEKDTLHIDGAVTALVNELNQLSSRNIAFSIVLDDFHVIQSKEILQQFAYFIDFLPANIEMIMTTRFEPSLPVSRWSVKNWVDQIHASELVFSFEESRVFLNEYMGLSLNDIQIEKIFNKTEGWIAAMQLAAISASETPNSEQTYISPENLFADDRHFSDYVLTEILEHQPEEVQTFLLESSCMLRLEASLCDYVRQQSNSHEILEHLLKSNLFLIPLDKNYQCFRFHDMFREALLNKFRLIDAAKLVSMQQRAVDWLIEHVQIHEAIDQVIQLKDWTRLLTLLEENGSRLIHEGHHLVMLDWLTLIPENIFRQSPRAFMLKIWALFFSNKVDLYAPLVDELEVLIDQQRLSNIETSTDELIDLHSEISLIRAYVARSHSDTESAEKLTKEVLIELNKTNMPLKSVTYYGIGLDSFVIGDLDSAETALLEAVNHGKREKKFSTVLSSSGLLGWIYFYQGKLETALEVGIDNQQCIDSYHDLSQPRLISCWQNSALALIYTEKSEFVIAESYINPMLKHLENGTEPGQHIIIQYTKATLLFAQKQFVDAIECLDDATNVYLHKRESIIFTPPSLISLKARCLLAMDQVDKAQQIVDELVDEDQTKNPLNNEDVDLTRIRILIASNKLEDALSLIDRLLDKAKVNQHVYHLIQALNLKAITLLKLQNKDGASMCIKDSLTLASQEGFISIYTNEVDIIQQALTLGANPSIPDTYLQKLTSTLGIQKEHTSKQIELPGAAALEGNKQLLEPLSQRELEVLHLIDNGLANKEIAQKLSLAPATVKAHIRNLYGKIEAKSRTDALLKARNLGLI